MTWNPVRSAQEAVRQADLPDVDTTNWTNQVQITSSTVRPALASHLESSTPVALGSPASAVVKMAQLKACLVHSPHWDSPMSLNHLKA